MKTLIFAVFLMSAPAFAEPAIFVGGTQSIVDKEPLPEDYKWEVVTDFPFTIKGDSPLFISTAAQVNGEVCRNPDRVHADQKRPNCDRQAFVYLVLRVIRSSDKYQVAGQTFQFQRKFDLMMANQPSNIGYIDVFGGIHYTDMIPMHLGVSMLSAGAYRVQVLANFPSGMENHLYLLTKVRVHGTPVTVQVMK